MNLLCDPSRPPLILSNGRSGSMLLTHNIGKINNSDPLTLYADSPEFLKKSNPPSPIQSHQLHTIEDLSRFTCFFNLRRNPVDKILSSVLANHFSLYHVWANQTILLEPFEFNNWPSIDNLCKEYVKWCNHYSPMLLPEHQVIYYEDYIAHLKEQQAYQRTFPEKKHLLTNYQQVLNYILKFEQSMLDAQAPFNR